MGVAVLLQGLALAASVGLGCGTCCGSSAGILLSGYVMTHARDTRQSMLAFLTFFAGKVAAVAALCLAASVLGQAAFLSEGPLAGVWAERAFDLLIVCLAIKYLVGWTREARGHRLCSGACPDHGRVRSSVDEATGRVRMGELFVAGAGFGVAPCAPLIVVAGLCVTLPAGYALLCGATFACASIATPALLVLIVTGVLTTHLRAELPHMLRWLRLACYLGMVGFFLADLIRTL